MNTTRTISVTVNGQLRHGEAEGRLLLSDFIRHVLRLTGTHVGCEHGVCGACTVLLDGEAVRSCLTFAVQADGLEIVTVEGLDGASGETLGPLQQAFKDCHALQCGYCTPGFLISAFAFLRDRGDAEISDDEIRAALSGNLCRCTGYQNIVRAVRQAAEASRDRPEYPT